MQWLKQLGLAHNMNNDDHSNSAFMDYYCVLLLCIWDASEASNTCIPQKTAWQCFFVALQEL